MNKDQFLSKYYLATPIFIFIELVWGINLRVNLPWSGDYLIYIYMAVCFVFGGFFLKKQLHLNLFALIESTANILMLLKSVYLPIFAMAHNPEAAGIKVENGDIIHFFIVGIVLLYAFYSNPLIRKKA